MNCLLLGMSLSFMLVQGWQWEASEFFARCCTARGEMQAEIYSPCSHRESGTFVQRSWRIHIYLIWQIQNCLCLPPSPVTWWTFCCSTSLFCSPVSPALFCAWEGLFLSISPLYLHVRNIRSRNPIHPRYMKRLLNESLSKTLIIQLDF